jgi:hypothetical protein
MSKIIKIAELNNSIQASLLANMLKNRGIPHYVRTYYDSAYDGLFLVQKGWGYIEAPEEYKEEILQVYDDLLKGKYCGDGQEK